MTLTRQYAALAGVAFLMAYAQGALAVDNKKTTPGPPARTTVRPAPAPVVRSAPVRVQSAPRTSTNVQAQQNAAIAAARARQATINQQRDRELAAVRAKQAAINRQRDADAAARANAARGGKPATNGAPAGYNTSRGNQVTIGSNRNTGGATAADRAAMDRIRAGTQALKDKQKKQGN